MTEFGGDGFLHDLVHQMPDLAGRAPYLQADPAIVLQGDAADDAGAFAGARGMPHVRRLGDVGYDIDHHKSGG